jgi:acetyl-CoA/propionyl-CoA carboxylase biotin carboxyl carrier protein
MFETVLVANRGEIAVRIIRTLRALGIRSVAVFSDADADARHVRMADVALRIGPADALHSYLDIDAILRAAVQTGADAIHPGYGFLSEHAEFARACSRAGLVFIGPPADAIEVMGDKIRAKERVAERGIPLVPGVGERGMTDRELIAAAAEIGYPLIIKPSAGGGGKGMEVVERAEELRSSLESARRIATAAFGDDTLLLERYVREPRHIEVQILADGFGRVIHLGERECSLQRRHQKVIEEAPSPLLDPQQRERIGAAACEVARAVEYRGAGTVEFLVSAAEPSDFFFMEMNTRLQVEHPVTEMVSGLDLVELQLQIASGERIPFAQDDLRLTGHAVEARLYAEDPGRGFLPSSGEIVWLDEPTAPGVRIDSGLDAGQTVGVDYDPMLAKVIAYGGNRAEAIARLDRALGATKVMGIHTNREFLRSLLAHPRVAAGTMDTHLVDELVTTWRPADAPDSVLIAAALEVAAAQAHNGSIWQQATGWRLGEHKPQRVRLRAGTGSDPDDVDLLMGRGESTVTLRGESHHARAGDGFVDFDGVRTRATLVRTGDTIFVSTDAADFEFAVLTREREIAERRASAGTTAGTVSPLLRSPMPGSVVAIHAVTGDSVDAGQLVVTVEAMKMEHKMLAPTAGVVTIDVQKGDRVTLDQVVAFINPHEGEST